MLKKSTVAHTIVNVFQTIGFVPYYKADGKSIIVLVRCKNNITYWFKFTKGGWTTFVAKNGKSELCRLKTRNALATLRNVYRYLPSEEAQQKLADAVNTVC